MSRDEPDSDGEEKKELSIDLALVGDVNIANKLCAEQEEVACGKQTTKVEDTIRIPSDIQPQPLPLTDDESSCAVSP